MQFAVFIGLALIGVALGKVDHCYTGMDVDYKPNDCYSTYDGCYTAIFKSNHTVKGCYSSQRCEDLKLYYFEDLGYPVTVACCPTNLCNTPTRVLFRRRPASTAAPISKEVIDMKDRDDDVPTFF